MGKCGLFVLVALFVVLSVVSVHAQNLLVNSSFEQDAVEDGLSPGWAVYSWGGSAGWVKPWGDTYGKWVAAAGGWNAGGVTIWCQSAPCVPGKQVTFRVQARGVSGCDGWAKLVLEFYGPFTEGGGMALATAECTPVTGVFGWTPLTVTATVPELAVRVRGLAWAEGMTTGCIEFDNASLETDGAPQQVTAGQAKTMPDGSLVCLKWPVVVKDNGSSFYNTDCYVADYGHEGVIRVIGSEPVYSNNNPVWLTKGCMLCVTGTVATVDGEKVIQATDLAPSSWDGPWPKTLAMNTKAVPEGIDKKGYLVKLAGKVNSVASDYSYFYISDGSRVTGEAGTGIKVLYPLTGDVDKYPKQDDVVSAIGVCWPETVEDTTYYVLNTRSANDVAPANQGGGDHEANLLQNPGLENGPLGWFYGPSFAVEPWAWHTGSRGAAIYGWDGNAGSPLSTWFGQTITATPGATYEFRTWVKKEASFIGDVKIKLEWRDANDQPVGSDVISDALAAGPDWQEFTINGTCPAGATKVNAVFAGENVIAGGAAMFDDAVLKITAAP